MIELFGEKATIIELLGFFFSIAGVWLTVKEKILCFPVGIISVLLYVWIFFKANLYSDAILQLIYVVLLIYGWYEWIHGRKNETQLPVTRTSAKTGIFLLVICIISTVTIGAFFKYNTDASIPFADALLTSMSLIAQWMVAKKKIENWIVWIVADVSYVAMYIYKDLYLTGVLYFIFIVLAVIGWMRWRKEIVENGKVRG